MFSAGRRLCMRILVASQPSQEANMQQIQSSHQTRVIHCAIHLSDVQDRLEDAENELDTCNNTS